MDTGYSGHQGAFTHQGYQGHDGHQRTSRHLGTFPWTPRNLHTPGITRSWWTPGNLQTLYMYSYITIIISGAHLIYIIIGNFEIHGVGSEVAIGMAEDYSVKTKEHQVLTLTMDEVLVLSHLLFSKLYQHNLIYQSLVVVLFYDMV